MKCSKLCDARAVILTDDIIISWRCRCGSVCPPFLRLTNKRVCFPQGTD